MLTKTSTLWVVRGVAAILFGLLVVMRPGASLSALVLVYGAYALADGSLLLAMGIQTEGPKAPFVVRGLVSVAAGVTAFAYPGLTALSLYVLIGAWAVFSGAAELVLAFTLGRDGFAIGGLVAAGLLAILCGVGLLALPALGVVALLGLIAGYALISGVVQIAAGVRLHRAAASLVSA